FFACDTHFGCRKICKMMIMKMLKNYFFESVEVRRKFSCAKSSRHLYSVKNILSAFFKRKLPKYRTGSDYLSHLGFYHTDLEKVFSDDFVIVEKSFSPFSWLGSQLNSQVFYKLVKKNEH
ncbi:MAG: hypothetical protein FWG84_09850, partial [Bacteroidales bacterium]|nr:hypothetical protein [Bacteroidales bacterium]